MKTFQQKLSDFTIQYPLENLAPMEDILFIDIETTGFTAKSSSLYLIGCSFFHDNHWNILQWFADTYEEEKEILQAFFEFSKDYQFLIHFNGNNFDLPFMLQKCNQHHLTNDFSSFIGVDIYKRVAPYKLFLKIPNCKQKTLEQFLGINRIDTFNGGELIGIYHDYVSTPNEVSRRLLLQHNFDDIQGMLSILPILSYYDLFNNGLKVKKVQANYYTDVHGNRKQELLMNVSLSVSLPVPVNGHYGHCFFSAAENQGVFKVPLYEEELKYFYSNYKDYYYLPCEDIALHKSVASFVDRQHRVQASASNCYTRKISTYLPQWEVVVEPFFKKELKSKELYFEVTDELKKDRKLFTVYAQHLLEMICSE